jgi:hypothetical protein
MIALAAAQLIEVARRPYGSDDELRAAAQEFFDAAQDATVAEANTALRTIGEAFELEDASRAAFLALVCGALIERGCDAEAIAAPILRRIGPLLESAGKLAAASEEQAREPKDDEDPDQVFQEARNRLASTMPDEDAAWSALETFWRPAIAVLSRSRQARKQGRSLADSASRISKYHAAGHWLRLMLSTLDDEPILVIEPETQLGIAGRMSGVTDNFQLHVLLMDYFPHSSRGATPRVSAEIASVFRGDGPQEAEGSVVGTWNLHSWKAIRPDGTLPPPTDRSASDDWIWGEGTPADIPVWDGFRVVLLGPASYQRCWGTSRTFDALQADIDNLRIVPAGEVRRHLERMIETKGGERVPPPQ